MRRISCLVVLALVGVGLSGVATSGASPNQVGDHAPVAHLGHLVRRVLMTGELEAAKAEHLTVPENPTWQTQIRWMAEDGSSVHAGDRLVDLDNTSVIGDLEEKKLTAQKSAVKLEQRRAELASQRQDKALAVETAKIELEKAQIQASVPAGLLSRYDMQKRVLARDQAKATLEKAEADLEAFDRGAAADLEVLKIAVAAARREIAIAEKGIKAFSLRAPADGVFLVAQHPWEGRKLQVGDTVWVGMSLGEIPDLASLGVAASLPDVDDGEVVPGDTGKCTLDTYPDLATPCTVERVGAIAEQPNPRSLRRSFRVWLRLAEIDPERMRPGMSVKVEIDHRSSRAELLVPRGTLDLASDQPLARLADGREAKVKLGPCSALACVVVSGLEAGERLAYPTEGRQ